MQIHGLKRRTPNKRSVQVGRGGTRGKTAGRGTKGQNARAGRKKRPEIRDVIKRLPKLRGRGVSGLKSLQSKVVAVNFDALEKTFSAGETVTPKILVEKGVIQLQSGKYPTVKILASGTLTKKLTIKACSVSAPARSKIEEVGGVISAN